ncbi:Peptidyl-prolyl cis-trans isomerase CWC27 like protein [Eufriesea mexicana]|uniref:Spliceosome-associated protein CWC27 homolog n=1 Tax=Eufriesea mexicana TaxID=516756 RepID=A0A310SJH6_9HYME|nr:Peptidyl-prolyl cis-trans isomerase CWC27 like protein [Eufriesea mexicana]
MELLVPSVSDVVFKYTWPISNYKKIVLKKNLIDSPLFDVNVNGIHSTWNLSIRFWKDLDGKRMINPMVLCLNMLNCTVDEAEQAKIRFQFSVFNADVKHWEYCHVSRTILELKSYMDIISLVYRDLSIIDRHLKKNGEMILMAKIQIIQYESEKHNLSQASTDMIRLLKYLYGVNIKLNYGCLSNTEFAVHNSVLADRSNVLTEMTKVYQKLFCANNCNVFIIINNYSDFYLYIFIVDNLDNFAPQLLSLAECFSLQRIIKGFITQDGDSTGTGESGKIYEEPLKDEFHTRLRFCRRDLIAMANAVKDGNDSQFFFTLSSTPELRNKHTIFSKVTGESIYSMLKLEQALVHENDRPTYPSRFI